MSTNVMNVRMFQRTTKNTVTLEGVGLHSGKPVLLKIKPGRPNQGISFVRTDLDGKPVIPALQKYVINTQLATTLGINAKISISTVEHILAALQGLSIDNAIIEVNGPEVPILDGSSRPFVEAIQAAGGAQPQFHGRTVLALRRKVEVRIGEKWAVAEPCLRFEIFGSIEWDHPAIGYQEFHYVEGKTDFSELSGARTFCLLREVEAMRKAGFAQGGTLDNAVVVDEANVLNPGGLRYADEFIRHKVLDALGDFKLAGFPVRGFFRLHRAGHDLHAQLMKAILDDPTNYELIHLTDVSGELPTRIRIPMARVAALG